MSDLIQVRNKTVAKYVGECVVIEYQNNGHKHTYVWNPRANTLTVTARGETVDIPPRAIL